MSWRVIVISKRAKLDLQLGYMVVRSEEVTKIVLSEISTILIESTAVSITTSLLSELSKRKIKVIFCDEKRNPSSELVSYYGSHDTSNKIRKQIAWKQNTKEAVWTEIVTEKIRKQKEILEILGKEESELLSSYIKEITWNDGTNREGHAAKVYFNALFGLDFTRTEDNYINAGLNYGYSIILSAFTREIVANGYITQLGLFHDNMFNQFNLASDLMEPFRVLIDQKIFQMKLIDFEHNEKMQLVDVLNQEVLIDGKGRYVLSDKEKEVDLAKNVEIIFDIFSLEINEKRILNKLYSEMNELAKSEEFFVKTQEVILGIQKYLLDLEYATDYILTFEQEIELPALFKAAGLRHEEIEENYFERIIRYVKIVVSILHVPDIRRLNSSIRT